MRGILPITAILLSVLGYAVPNPGLRDVRSVYIFPMASSLDQYLANALVKEGRFEVVTDPQRADAFFTDRIGTQFEDKMNELFPPPPTGDEQSKDDSEKQVRFGGFSRSRGTVFLIQRESRSVVWSVFEPAKTSRPDELVARARHIVQKLSGDLKRLDKAAGAPKPVQPAAAVAPADKP